MILKLQIRNQALYKDVDIQSDAKVKKKLFSSCLNINLEGD